MSEQIEGVPEGLGPSRCYATEVKEAVGKLLDLAACSSWHTLVIDTDEDEPSVELWYRGKHVRANGLPRAGWISPEPEADGSGDYWSFLECCQRALAEAAKLP
jgi:hypothetical protein